MARLELKIEDMEKIVDRILVDRAGSKTINNEIVMAIVNYMQSKETERRSKALRSTLIMPGRPN